MSESKHTPGPWKAFVNENGAFEIWNERHDNRGLTARFIICSRNPIEHRAEASRANARLIVAAPELLAAAEAALAEMINTTALRNSFTDAVDLLDAAIAKAKGETP